STHLMLFRSEGLGHHPVCIAKTQYSFSTDAALKAAPSGHVVPIREVRLSAGAEFVVVICGDIMTMPGLPKVPAANSISIDRKGRISGLFSPPPERRKGRAKARPFRGAVEKTRTSKGFPPLAPQASASTNSATTAFEVARRGLARGAADDLATPSWRFKRSNGG